MRFILGLLRGYCFNQKTQEMMQIMSQLTEATRRADYAEGNAAAVKRTVDGLQARCARNIFPCATVTTFTDSSSLLCRSVCIES